MNPLPSDHPLTNPSDDERKSALRAGGKHWLASVRLVSFLTLISRVLGLVRDMGMAAIFGNGPLLDSFTLAFRLPNLCRRLFGEGALTTAFLPEYLRADKTNPQQGEQLASAVLAILTGILSALVVLTELLISWQLQGTGLSPASREIYQLTAWMLPYVIVICLAAQLSAILHAKGHFTIPALIPSVLNGIWLVTLWSVVPSLGTPFLQMQAVIVAILIGGLAQFLLPLGYLYYSGFRLHFRWAQQARTAVKVFRLMLPIVIGLSVSQINAICDSTLAWWYSQPEQGEWVAPGTASALYFGQRMYQFPLGIFGIALGTVLFARLAQHVESGEREQVSRDVLEGLRLILLVGIPSTLGMMLLSEPLTEVLFKRGEFDAQDVEQTAATVLAYGTAIWAFLGVTVLQRVFFALEDSTTPVRAGLLTVGLNFVLNFVLLFMIGGSGLAYATSFASMVQFLLLIYLLRFRIALQFDHGFWQFLGKLALATAVMSLLCWMSDHWLTSQKLLPLWASRLAGPILISVLCYFVCLKLLRVQELSLLTGQQRSATGTGDDDNIQQ